jgi:ZIP family zinc transporter
MTTCTGWSCPNVPAAIGVSVGAGLATGVGGALVFFPQFIRAVPQQIILGVSLALSAGVMLYVSFNEIFAKSLAEIEGEFDPDDKPGTAVAITTVCFFAGMFICICLELFVHWLAKKRGIAQPGCAAHACAAHAHSHADALTANGDGDHDCVDGEVCKHSACESEPLGNAGDMEMGARKERASSKETAPAATTATTDVAYHVADVKGGTGEEGEGKMSALEQKKLTRMGVMTALAIGVHNFPEGLATFLATVDDISSGASLGVAIAIHNIPEGLCVAMPIFYATGSKWKAFGWSLLSGITEPIGGIAGYAILQPLFTPLVYGIVFSMVGGMMVFIVCHELLPAAHRYMGSTNKATAWFLAGMIIMAASLVLFTF